LWRPESLSSLYLTYADPEVIGLSAIGGLLQPTTRESDEGLMIELASDTADAQFNLRSPIAPGMMRDVPIASWAPLHSGVNYPVSLPAGVVALDGEREMAFKAGESVTISLIKQAFFTVDVTRCLQLGAVKGLFRS
jgi:hypothetical protein